MFILPNCNNHLLLHVSPALLQQLQKPLVASRASNPTTSAATTACCFICTAPYYNNCLLLQLLVASCVSNPTTTTCCFSASNPTTTACCFSIQPYHNSSSLTLTPALTEVLCLKKRSGSCCLWFSKLSLKRTGGTTPTEPHSVNIIGCLISIMPVQQDGRGRLHTK